MSGKPGTEGWTLGPLAGTPWPWIRSFVSSPRIAFWKHNVLTLSIADQITRSPKRFHNDPEVRRLVISRRRRNHRRSSQCCAVAMPPATPVDTAAGADGLAVPTAPTVEVESSERARQREIAA